MANQENHIMVDIETWGLKPGSAIRSIAAIRFNPSTGQDLSRFRVVIDPASHMMPRDPATEAWWESQSVEAKSQFENAELTPLAQALTALNIFWMESSEAAGEVCLFWAKSPSFDSVLLKAAYEHVSLPMPWSYREEMDVRTVHRLAGSPEVAPVGVTHNDIDDCLFQIALVAESYRALDIPGVKYL